MLLYVVVTIFQLVGAPDTDPPLEVFRGTSIMTEKKCDEAAQDTLQLAKKLVRKYRVPLIAVTYCSRAGYEV